MIPNTDFFCSQIMKADRYLAPHYAYYVREIKVFMLFYICVVELVVFLYLFI